ncbi:AurF N-oxygenase family protein [Lentzea aerocolonigenes]|uniref:AurF N-oxygenase family protein n=1 Tax=Lentzea aerocolonigenes TaxID=68170 RepID=UPI0004C39F45|nr:diiron oxygenase [Lentzea aerocolonigenes]MCP2250966.1 P-aminobenzoate N-oxygenase AurF [Lentzea aerocolonigenes]
MRVADREKTAERLLKSSAEKFYDPEVDIDWSAPLVDGLFYIPEQRISLYGTPLYDSLTHEQRIELSKHELASIASVGLWFELLLMQMLVKVVYNTDPTSRHAQYALTEVADECRHSTMFARLVERIGCPPYGPVRSTHRLGKLLPAIGYGPAMYGSILVAEEILDRLQREAMNDDTIQPIVRMVNRIHVLEEARHVRFAREELVRGMADLRGFELPYQKWLIGYVSMMITRTIINPAVYAAVGLDVREARRQALANPRFQETIRWSGERIMSFLEEAGLVGKPGMRSWRRSFLIG